VRGRRSYCYGGLAPKRTAEAASRTLRTSWGRRRSWLGIRRTAAARLTRRRHDVGILQRTGSGVIFLIVERIFSVIFAEPESTRMTPTGPVCMTMLPPAPAIR
jgi:hypothetical protein